MLLAPSEEALLEEPDRGGVGLALDECLLQWASLVLTVEAGFRIWANSWTSPSVCANSRRRGDRVDGLPAEMDAYFQIKSGATDPKEHRELLTAIGIFKRWLKGSVQKEEKKAEKLGKSKIRRGLNRVHLLGGLSFSSIPL